MKADDPTTGRRAVLGTGAAFAASVLLRPTPSRAEAYSTQTIRLVVPYAAGGGVDVVGRLTAKELNTRLGQPVIVENKPGAGTNIGASFVARAAPDGYTLLMASPANAINVTLYKDVPYDTVRDLAPVVLIGQVPSVLVVNKGLKATTLAQFVDLAKQEPGKLTFGSGGVGASEHLAGALFMNRAGVNMVHVPYRGGALAMTDLIGGQISSVIINEVTALPFVQGGEVRALAVASKARSPFLPGVPTFAEQGYPDYLISVWWGVMAPAHTPAAVIDQLNAAANEGLASPEMKQNMTALGAETVGGTPEAFAAFLGEEIKRWGEAVKLSGASLG